MGNKQQRKKEDTRTSNKEWWSNNLSKTAELLTQLADRTKLAGEHQKCIEEFPPHTKQWWTGMLVSRKVTSSFCCYWRFVKYFFLSEGCKQSLFELISYFVFLAYGVSWIFFVWGFAPTVELNVPVAVKRSWIRYDRLSSFAVDWKVLDYENSLLGDVKSEPLTWDSNYLPVLTGVLRS